MLFIIIIINFADMNFLAHAYLSGNNDGILLGNFVADSIKGKQYLDYPSDVGKGILLHRKIDYYTDSHKVFRDSKKRLSAKYGIFSGIIIDIFYDHFLARNWDDYSEVKLKSFVKKILRSLI